MADVPTYYAPDGKIYTGGGDVANCTLEVGCPVELSVYGYRPTIAGSSVLIALYAICMVIQTILGWRYRTWTFMGCMILGCIDEILGYVGRIMMWDNPWNDTGFIMQIVLITIGPVFFSAAIYILLYQIVLYIDPSSSRFDPKYFYWGFIPCDIVSLILQAAGGAMSSTSNGDSDAGVNIALAGLAFQVFTLLIFVIAVVDYAIRSRPFWSQSKLPLKFLVFIGAITLATIFIFTRCAYRLYELHEGYSEDSEALRDEELFNALEASMVILSAYALVLGHPGPPFKEQRLAKTGMAQENNEEKGI